MVALSLVTTYKGGIQQLLFGDILGISWLDLALIAVLLVAAVSIKAVGVLLISAFMVIPACASRLVIRHFGSYLVLSSLIGGGCAVLGLLGSGLTNLPSGPGVVIEQFFGFLLALGFSQWRRQRG